MKGANYKTMILFALGWSAMTLMFDGFMLVPAARQVNALRFPATEGVILSSEVTYHEDSDGTTCGVAIRYTYSVGGSEYEGDRYRYDTSTSSDSGWAHRAVNARPAGAKVKVFYNPTDPEDAVLSPSIQGSDLFHFTFMTPFNAAMLGFWWAGWVQLRRKWFKPLAGGAKIKTELRRTRARLSEFSPLGAGSVTVALLAFLSIFVVGILGGGFHPPLRTMLITWAVILSGGVVAGVWHWAKILSGKYDLIIDTQGDTLELPLTCGRKTRRQVPFAQVQGVRVDTVQKSSSGDGEPAVMHAPTLELAGAESSEERLAEWYDSKRAEGFVEWLRSQLPPPKKTPPRPLAGRF